MGTLSVKVVSREFGGTGLVRKRAVDPDPMVYCPSTKSFSSVEAVSIGRSWSSSYNVAIVASSSMVKSTSSRSYESSTVSGVSSVSTFSSMVEIRRGFEVVSYPSVTTGVVYRASGGFHRREVLTGPARGLTSGDALGLARPLVALLAVLRPDKMSLSRRGHLSLKCPVFSQ